MLNKCWFINVSIIYFPLTLSPLSPFSPLPFRTLTLSEYACLHISPLLSPLSKSYPLNLPPSSSPSLTSLFLSSPHSLQFVFISPSLFLFYFLSLSLSFFTLSVFSSFFIPCPCFFFLNHLLFSFFILLSFVFSSMFSRSLSLSLSLLYSTDHFFSLYYFLFFPRALFSHSLSFPSCSLPLPSPRTLFSISLPYLPFTYKLVQVRSPPSSSSSSSSYSSSFCYSSLTLPL